VDGPAGSTGVSTPFTDQAVDGRLASTGVSTPFTDLPQRIPVRELRAWYHAYRIRQGRLLAALVPREAIRPLYRQARSNPVDGEPSPADGELERLAAHCASLLPLPPFDMWLEDLRSFPAGHMEDMDASTAGSTVYRPLTLAVGEIQVGEEEWRVRFRVFMERGLWHAFLRFDLETRTECCWTAVLFHEPTLRDLRARFDELDGATFEAFLRSARG